MVSSIISSYIPLGMVLIFLLFTLIVTFYCTNRFATFREYAIGNKQFPTAYLVATVLATTYGGEKVIWTSSYVHTVGISFVLIILVSGCLHLWVVSWLASRMESFMHNLSMSDTIGRVYGSYARIVTALFQIFLSIVTITIQIHGMAMAITMCIDLPNQHIVTGIAILILGLYSTVGGIRTVTITDVVQLGAFLVVFPLLYFWIFMKINKPIEEVFSFLQTQERFLFSSMRNYNIKQIIALIMLLLATSMDGIKSPIIQRIYMCSDHNQARRVFWNAGMGSLLIMTFILLIGVFGVVATCDLPLEEGTWGYIIKNISPVFKGFVAISLLAITMSTADSYLNSCAVTFSHDVVNTILSARTIPYTSQLFLAKITALVVIVLSTFLSFYYDNELELLHLVWNYYTPIVVPSFVLALLNFRSTSRTAVGGMVVGALAIVAWNKWVRPLEPTIEINGTFPCMVVNGLAMVCIHYLSPQRVRKEARRLVAKPLKIENTH